MKNILFKWLLIIGIGMSLGSVAIIANAYHCEWRNGQKICWHNNIAHNCHWVNGYWHHGYYHKGHRVCWIK